MGLTTLGLDYALQLEHATPLLIKDHTFLFLAGCYPSPADRAESMHVVLVRSSNLPLRPPAELDR